jgi:gliding motility-associated-like protein
VTTNCDEQKNMLTWTFPGDTCSHDVAKLLIYYSPVTTQEPVLTDSVTNLADTSYAHAPPFSVVGCYLIQAVDSAGNASALSNTVCVDYTVCPVYELPNVFTPNNDGINDFFIPFPYSSVEKVSMVIVNRWGKQVYHTSDPDIRWNGEDETTGQPCSDGVYFYVCDVYEVTLEGTLLRTLKGSVTILR